MRKKSGFVLREIADRTIIVPTGAMVFDLDGIVSLNQTGRWIWDRLDTPQTPGTLTQGLCAEFDVDETAAGKDVEEFLAELSGLGLLEP